ncbi:hypothetical protein AB0N62_39455 [Streptomyces sp. NPDC093982]|uniref:hypothetical protein n=1 Tax=Streptomyces sp. NPDC093982 TaxID=3155077 RepID=UPI00343FF9D6
MTDQSSQEVVLCLERNERVILEHTSDIPKEFSDALRRMRNEYMMTIDEECTDVEREAHAGENGPGVTS